VMMMMVMMMMAVMDEIKIAWAHQIVATVLQNKQTTSDNDVKMRG